MYSSQEMMDRQIDIGVDHQCARELMHVPVLVVLLRKRRVVPGSDFVFTKHDRVDVLHFSSLLVRFDVLQESGMASRHFQVKFTPPRPRANRSGRWNQMTFCAII